MTAATEVDAHHAADGRVTVRSFTWRGQRYRVTSQGRQWTAGDGRHVLVMVPGDRVFELVYASEDGRWRVAQAPTGPSAA